jgi:hypothetical protein
MAVKNPNSFAKTNLMGNVKSLSSKKIFIKIDNISKSLCIKHPKT